MLIVEVTDFDYVRKFIKSMRKLRLKSTMWKILNNTVARFQIGTKYVEKMLIEICNVMRKLCFYLFITVFKM